MLKGQEEEGGGRRRGRGRNIKNINKKILQRKNIFIDKDKHIIKAVDQPTLKLVQRLKAKSRKIMCNYNSKLKDTHKQNKKK